MGNRWIAFWFLLPLLQGSLAGKELTTKVEATFMRHFAHYVTWPAHAFADDRSPWNVCILGPDPFGDALEAAFRGRVEEGREFLLFRADRIDDLPPCQMIFIAYPDAGRRRAALEELKEKPVLTVGDGPRFLERGGIIRFRVDQRVRIDINLDQARTASLKIRTEMLEVAGGILENGVLRKMR